MAQVTVSKDKSGRTIYCVGSKYFYTRVKAEAHAGVSSSARKPAKAPRGEAGFAQHTVKMQRVGEYLVQGNARGASVTHEPTGARIKTFFPSFGVALACAQELSGVKAPKSRKTAAKTRGTSTASDAYHWLHAGRRNPKRNPRTGRFVRRNR